MKNRIQNKLTIIVNTCDSYADLWPLFFSALNEYWKDRSIKIVVNTEEKKDLGFHADNTIIHTSQSTFWGERLLDTLHDINTEYILMLYDDFIIDQVFDESILYNIIGWMDSNLNISVFYLQNLNINNQSANICFGKFKRIDPYSDYRLNSAPGVWRKQDLLRFTGKEDNPWAWEVFGTYRTQRTLKEFYQPDDKIYSFDGSKGGAIYRGKWVKHVVIDKVKKYNLDIDFNVRGFSSENQFEKRSFKWKMNFIYIGYKMVGFDVFKFILKSLKNKLIHLF